MPTLPERQHGNAGAAQLLGLSKNTWYSYQRQGMTPEPDGRIDRTDWWWESTLVEWHANRPGPGNWTRGEDRTPGSIRRATPALTAGTQG